MNKYISIALTGLMLSGFSSTALAGDMEDGKTEEMKTENTAMAGDPVKGAKVWKKCKVCHTLDAKSKRKMTGPNLYGVIGRTAGTLEGFKYSKSMKQSGEDGLVWNEENIAKYLKKPKEFVKKNKMAFAGLKKEEDRLNVIAYIKQEIEKQK